jgi:hypothetical protein
MSYSFRAGPGWNAVPSWSCSKAVYKPVWHTPLLSLQWISSWLWAEELSETCRVSCQNKFVKSVHLVGFIIKKFVIMHDHKNVKKWAICLQHYKPVRPFPQLPFFNPENRQVGHQLFTQVSLNSLAINPNFASQIAPTWREMRTNLHLKCVLATKTMDEVTKVSSSKFNSTSRDPQIDQYILK